MGYGDCDGNAAVAGSNGCEYSFGLVGSDNSPLEAPKVQIRLDDNSRDDWAGVLAHTIAQTCLDCEENERPPIVQPNEPPPPEDLTAYFRVAWDLDFFYVLAEAFDNEVFSAGSTVNDGRCMTNGDYVPGPSCEDSFAVMFDGRQDGGNYGFADHRVFVGLSNGFFAPAQGQPPDGTVATQVISAPGPYCYRIEARFAWGYLVGTDQPVSGKFPPLEGQTYGFDIAANDWDQSLSNTDFERQSQLFWNVRTPNAQIGESVEGVGSVVLGDDALQGSEGGTTQ